MKLFPNRRKEPRQPQKHRGAVVHTEQSEGYDDRITQGLIEKNILDEARASVALDKGDDGTYAVEGGLPRTSVPSDASEPDKKEEPTVSKKKRTALPGGQQGDDVIHAITTYCEVGQTFDAAKVWATLGQRKQAEWIKAYGGRDAAFRKVKVALNNINYSGRIGIERLADQKFRYTGPDGTPSDAYVRNIVGSKARNAKRRAKETKVPVDKPVSKPATVAKPTKLQEHEGYRLVGHDLDGRPLYVEHETQRVGHVKVVVRFEAV